MTAGNLGGAAEGAELPENELILKAAGAFIVNALIWPIFVVDSGGQIIFANAAFTSGNLGLFGYHITDRRLRHSMADFDQQITHLMTDYTSFPRDLVVLPEDAPWSILHARVLAESTPKARKTIIVMRHELVVGDSQRAILARSLNLTDTEVDILMDLMRGDAISDICARRSIKEGTVRWHIKNVMKKTGTKRQRALLRIAFSKISPLP